MSKNAQTIQQLKNRLLEMQETLAVAQKNSCEEIHQKVDKFLTDIQEEYMLYELNFTIELVFDDSEDSINYKFGR